VVTLASAKTASAVKLKPKPLPAVVPPLVDANADQPASAPTATAPLLKRLKSPAALKKSLAALKFDPSYMSHLKC